jgi:hypothetical protein
MGGLFSTAAKLPIDRRTVLVEQVAAALSDGAAFRSRNGFL